jgi:uncharacterized protein (UPF0264 family)
VKLLVSVANPIEACNAVEGGADLIDAKDPLSGALGAVSLPTLLAIHAAVAGRRAVTAAIGDGSDEATIERTARQYGAAGVAFIKLGFAGIADHARVTSLIAAAVQGMGASGTPRNVVAVAYADAERTSIDRVTLLELAAQAGASGVLVDTADKQGPGLRQLVSSAALTSWVDAAHGYGLTVAVAGKLTADDLSWVLDTGADIAGVRGAACEGDRSSRVVTERVSALKSKMCYPLVTR